MSDISNKTLAILVGIAIVVSLVGILSIGKGGIVYLTGAQTTAPVSFNATSEASILVTGSIDWGNGRVNSDATQAVLNSTDGGSVEGGSWTPTDGKISVENDGTVNVSVNISSDKAAAAFIGGTSPSFKMLGIAAEGGCAGTLLTDAFEMTVAEQVLCTNLKHGGPTEDQFNVSAIVTVPSDAEAEQKTATITFEGTAN